MQDKKYLNDLVKKYETKDFITSDPIQFPHRFKIKQDVEISALISSSLAYGRREHFIKVLDEIHTIMKNQPYSFCKNYDFKTGQKLFAHINYRFTTGLDIAALIFCIFRALNENDDIEQLYLKGYSESDKDYKNALINFVSNLLGFADELNIDMKGLKYLLPSPVAGSATKRLNLFLKWMIRDGEVDLGIWKNLPKSKLLIPLDTHVAKISRKLNLTQRASNDWKTAAEITEKLKKYDPNDPTKYDFALFGAGIFE